MADEGTREVSVPKEIKTFLKIHPGLEILPDKNKIKCSLTGHEMPCKLEILQKHTQGKKYLRLHKDKEFNYDRFKPHLLPSNKKGHLNQLFCMLTLRHINKQPSHVERHLHGKRYKKALARYEECQKTGETFKPNRPTKKIQNTSESDEGRGKLKDSLDMSDTRDDGNVSDTMSDLYPDDAFDEGEDDENEEDDDDDEDEEDEKDDDGDNDAEGDNSDFDFDDMDVNDGKVEKSEQTGKKRKHKEQGNTSGFKPKKMKPSKKKTKLPSSHPKKKSFKEQRKKSV
ncbi:surfeit locus protein 2-like [Glandiceps talaboti]